jgi:hypothetical protein
MRYEDPCEFPDGDHEIVGECSLCGSWPVPADEHKPSRSECCGAYLIVD